MSDSESTTAAAVGPPHPHLGGKSLQSLSRPRYKSWRKKYRKIRHTFDTALEENKRFFKEEQKLEAIARRLGEELDGLLELSLDLNQTAAIPPSLRFDVSLPHREPLGPAVVPKDITPEQANDLLLEYNTAVRTGQIPPLDLHVIRLQIEDRLAAQDTLSLNQLETLVPHLEATNTLDLNLKGEELPGYMTVDQETGYLLRLDAKASGDHQPYTLTPKEKEIAEKVLASEEKHWAERTPREIERQTELQNPQSQHSWLKHHTKLNLPPGGTAGAGAAAEADDAESDAPPKKKRNPPAAKSGGGGVLAKQALQRAREEGGVSPSAVSNMDEEDPLALPYDDGGASRRKGKDPDQTYRVKGGKSGGGGASRGKRKRSDVDVGAGGKKAKVEGSGAGTPGPAESRVE